RIQNWPCLGTRRRLRLNCRPSVPPAFRKTWLRLGIDNHPPDTVRGTAQGLMTVDERLALWHHLLPVLRKGIDDGLRRARVSYTSNVTIEDWIHGEPSMAVYWDMPSPRNW